MQLTLKEEKPTALRYIEKNIFKTMIGMEGYTLPRCERIDENLRILLKL